MRPNRQARAKVATAARGVLGHVLVFVTLLAFALQGFVTQTHIHIPAVGTTEQADSFDGGKVPGKAPSKNDEANCPICQAFASAGHFVTPAVAAALALTVTTSVITLAVEASHLVPLVTHIWHGRAPPQGRSH